jgi:hypothetical protein
MSKHMYFPPTKYVKQTKIFYIIYEIYKEKDQPLIKQIKVVCLDLKKLFKQRKLLTCTSLNKKKDKNMPGMNRRYDESVKHVKIDHTLSKERWPV